ncbi:site-specific integrase [Rhizobium sp. BG4]|uniref:site-specific integrase n=1 Tax=Rhizobium sp. BG4 TaxID=2613770 RepID=UPI00193DCF4C|nr:site-specific integrase [Rhizobium sp. BG4]QRM42811.1 tyrosine-type recombinase/integrase [Rhizobium sp. BG4]
MADTRYLKQRRQGWYFAMKVPADLVDKIGKSDIVQSLRTRDLTQAQKDRWPLVAECTAQFEVLRGKRTWTPTEIEDKAQEEYEATLKMLAEHNESEENVDIFAELEAEKLESGKLNDLDHALVSARIAAAAGRRAVMDGRTFTLPRAFGRNGIDMETLQPVTLKKRKTGEAFADAARRYIEEIQRDSSAKLTEQTRGQYEAVYRLFDQWAGKPSLDEVDRKQAAEFLDKIATLDPHWGRSPQTKQRTFSEIVKDFGNHEIGLSNRTINRYATALSMVWQWAKRRGLLTSENPWEDQYRKIGEKRKTKKLPFTVEEMRKLLATRPEVRPATQDNSNTLAWLCLISAYSGMRLNEMCDRKVVDIKQEDGVWYFNITNAKSEAGDRKVPLHSRLIAAGLLDFMRHHKSEWLFPALKPGGPDGKRSWYISKRFTERRRALKITRPDERTGKDRVDFHSFRRSAIKVLERARLPQTEVAQVVGHDREGITFGTYNPDGLDIHALQHVVEAIRYPEIEQASAAAA